MTRDEYRKMIKCGDKIRYPTEGVALGAAVRAAKRQNECCLRVYQCDKCNGFHITHQSHKQRVLTRP